MRPERQRFARPQMAIVVVSVFGLSAIGGLSASENQSPTEITLGEAKALVATIKSVAYEFQLKRDHGVLLEPPVATANCPYFLFKVWADDAGSASNLIGWYRVNKRNADVWEDPPYNEQPINEQALAAEQTRLRKKHHIGEALVKEWRNLESWGPDCFKPTY